MPTPSENVKEAINKFKVDDTTPLFAISPTGSYRDINAGIKNQYGLKFKDIETKSVTKTYGILSNNLSTLPPVPKTYTILQFEENININSFEWSLANWFRDYIAPADFSYITFDNITQLLGVDSFPMRDKLKSITVGNTIINISKDAFKNCTSLESVTIPTSVTSIGPNAFKNCTSLESVIFPYTLGYIGEHCFADCTSLKYVSLPKAGSRIDQFAFENCTSLENITVPYKVFSIGSGAFSGSGLITVTIEYPNPLGQYSPISGVNFYGKDDVDIILPTS